MEANKDLEGKIIVVTGATAGIGYAAARALVERGAWVIGVGRMPEKGRAAQQAILAEAPEGRLVFCSADLASQRQVRQLAADVAEQAGAWGGKIDALVNNAGTVSEWYTATEDGYELQFAVNHLAPFLLTYELLPLLRAAPAGRVITVSSGSHRNMRIHWADVMYRRHYNILLAYKQSKLANVLFTYEFNRRLGKDSNLRAYAVDPGLVNTEIGMKGTGGLVSWFWKRRSAGGVTPEKAAATVVYLAAEPQLVDTPVAYWKDCRPLQPSPYARSEAEAARLWAFSEQLCGIDFGPGAGEAPAPAA